MAAVPLPDRTFASLLADAGSYTQPALGYPAIVAAYGSTVATAGGELKTQLVGTGTHSPVTVAIITSDDDVDVISIAHSFFTYHRILGAPNVGLDGRVYGIMGNVEGQLLPIEITDNAMSRVAAVHTLNDAPDLRVNLVNFTINNRNKDELEGFLSHIHGVKQIRGTFFYFHTPYYGRDELYIEPAERAVILRSLLRYKRRYRILNSRAGLYSALKNDWKRPLKICSVYEQGDRYECCRYSDDPELCRNCGYLSYAERDRNGLCTRQNYNRRRIACRHGRWCCIPAYGTEWSRI